MSANAIKLNPNYQLLERFPGSEDFGPFGEKLERLAIDIGNCLLKVGAKPPKTYLRKLKKFFIKSNWFKKVRIINCQLYLWRRRGRFVIKLTPATIYNLKCDARERKNQLKSVSV